MDRVEKQQEIELLDGLFAKSQITICADYRGLTVAQVTELRKNLRKNDCFGKVVKNTLAKISIERSFKEAKAAELEKFSNLLEGPSLMVFSYSDPVAPSKILSEFAKSNDKLKIKGGWLDGSFVDAPGVDMLAKLPGKQETLGKLLGLLAAPATQLVRLLQAPSTQIVRVIDAHRENLEKKAA